ncbi:MAG: hypothetical protein ACREWI_04965, partial [Telluria sp.]
MHAPHPSGRRPVRPYPRARLVIVTAGLIAALGMVTASMLYASYEDALREQQVTLRNVAIVFAAQTTAVAQAVDGASRRAASLYRARGAGALAPGFLEEHAGSAQPYVARLAVFDAAGRLAASVSPGSSARRLP